MLSKNLEGAGGHRHDKAHDCKEGSHGARQNSSED